MLTAKVGFFRATAHPEALSWQTRAIANGGTVSASTLNAVSAFCTSIDAAGLRGRFVRLNLCCGGNLAAALVPLYRGTSASGTQFGNATDTNFNFVAGDYSESAGLLGNGSTKYIDTGVSLNAAGIVTTGHFSLYRAAWNSVAGSVLMGCLNGAFTQIHQIGINGSNNAYETYYGASTLLSGTSLSSSAAHLILSRTSSTAAAFYTNGSPNGSSSSSTSASDPVRSVFVFARNQGGAAGIVSARVRAYSIGASITAGQASTLYPIFAAFATALGRTPA